MEFLSFKRLVVGLQPSAQDRTLRLAADLAHLLDLELLGLFLEDTGLQDLAGIPFAREFRPLGGGWRPLEVERLRQELELAARSAERIFTKAVKHLPTKRRFEVIRGPTAEMVESISRTDDIVMVIAPANPAERTSRQFAWFLEAAFRSAAAVFFVPPHIARAAGPVVAIAAGGEDPSIRTAAAIAIAAREGLIIVELGPNGAHEPWIRKLAVDTGLHVEHVAAGNLRLSDPAACSQAFRRLQERLVVMTRGLVDLDTALSIASLRHVPVLVIEPPDATPGEPLTQSETAG